MLKSTSIISHTSRFDQILAQAAATSLTDAGCSFATYTYGGRFRRKYAHRLIFRHRISSNRWPRHPDLRISIFMGACDVIRAVTAAWRRGVHGGKGGRGWVAMGTHEDIARLMGRERPNGGLRA